MTGRATKMAKRNKKFDLVFVHRHATRSVKFLSVNAIILCKKKKKNKPTTILVIIVFKILLDLSYANDNRYGQTGEIRVVEVVQYYDNENKLWFRVHGLTIKYDLE